MLNATGKWVSRLARLVAILGGIVLIVLSVMTVLSIFGRVFLWAGLKPIKGDFEMVEGGIAFVICAFLPWCQLEKAHASVGILTDNFSRRANAVIDLIVDLLLCVTAMFLTWRHFFGLLDKQKYGETTFILQYPLWWAYAGMLVGLVTWIIVGVWCVWASADAVRKGEPRLVTTGAVH